MIVVDGAVTQAELSEAMGALFWVMGCTAVCALLLAGIGCWYTMEVRAVVIYFCVTTYCEILPTAQPALQLHPEGRGGFQKRVSVNRMYGARTVIDMQRSLQCVTDTGRSIP